MRLTDIEKLIEAASVGMLPEDEIIEECTERFFQLTGE